MPQDVGEVGALVQSLLPPLVFVLGLVLILGMGVEGRLSVSAASSAHSGTVESPVVPAMWPVCLVTADPRALSCSTICLLSATSGPFFQIPLLGVRPLHFLLQRSWLRILYTHLPHTT